MVNRTKSVQKIGIPILAIVLIIGTIGLPNIYFMLEGPDHATKIFETYGIDPTLDMEQPHIYNTPEYYEDWCFYSTLNGSDGKEYYLGHIITLKNASDFSSIHISSGDIESVPFWLYESITGSWTIRKDHHYDSGTTQVDVSGDSVNITLDKMKIICAPPNTTILYDDTDIILNITYYASGPSVGPYPDWVAFTPNSNGTAYWTLANVIGDITINGTLIHLEGVGIYEHVWLKSMSFYEMKWMDWMWYHFDQGYGLFFHTDAIEDFSQWQNTIYLYGEKKAFPMISGTTTYSDWMYAPLLDCFVPDKIKITIELEIGWLEITGDCFIFQPIDSERLLGGWEPRAFYAMGNDACHFSGTITYNNGTVLQLTSGIGGYQCNIAPVGRDMFP